MLSLIEHLLPILNSIKKEVLQSSHWPLSMSMSCDTSQVLRHSSWMYFTEPEHLQGVISGLSELFGSMQIRQVDSS